MSLFAFQLWAKVINIFLSHNNSTLKYYENTVTEGRTGFFHEA